ncbi:hypothetical protein K378_05240 [Streptomyces sp. Amel2xB2]|uniref:Uncharacterized protein n=1 Tax=Streptomyces nanshensis TaxID=518642 RepID=A0A1E7KWQ0_9ACTN|nr:MULTISPECIES: hypothetical protein [Streptomyces]OEV08356.1 hypothetical protein AN218_26815 [Streptomyces nanshensis]RAJ58360.1 hypothetical protein K378_05240 [Streptomyces sp. Amel2xB2]
MRAVPDALRISCTGDVVRIDLPDGDVRLRLHSAPGGTRIGLQVAYRENRPSGRTWWSSWERSVAAPPASPSVGAVLTAEVAASRREFARELDSVRICEAALESPVDPAASTAAPRANE